MYVRIAVKAGLTLGAEPRVGRDAEQISNLSGKLSALSNKDAIKRGSLVIRLRLHASALLLRSRSCNFLADSGLYELGG